ncbi:MAG: molecular chaperone DnaJ, partial [Verrucomicrobiota bacterium]|nr:molecular chaperone DnaJ [Verrucomicrobiota bacterium]
GHAGVDPQAGISAGAGFGDIFSDIFGEIFGSQRGGRSNVFRGADLRYNLEIALEQAAHGFETKIRIPTLAECETCHGSGAKPGTQPQTCATCRGAGQVRVSQGPFSMAQTCPRCHGTGEIVERPCKTCGGEGRAETTSRIKLKIPAGIEDGSRLRSSRNGEAGVRGGAPGDLYVVVHIKEHAVFEREGDNLYCEVPVSFVTASLGGEIRVPTLEGNATLKVPAGSQGGTTFKLRGKGMKNLSSNSRGDLLVRVLVEVPTKLNAEQRKKLEEFAELCGEENTPLHQSFFERAKEFFR